MAVWIRRRTFTAVWIQQVPLPTRVALSDQNLPLILPHSYCPRFSQELDAKVVNTHLSSCLNLQTHLECTSTISAPPPPTNKPLPSLHMHLYACLKSTHTTHLGRPHLYGCLNSTTHLGRPHLYGCLNSTCTFTVVWIQQHTLAGILHGWVWIHKRRTSTTVWIHKRRTSAASFTTRAVTMPPVGYFFKSI